MALFKVLRGNQTSLPTDIHDGWAYVSDPNVVVDGENTGNFYVDISDSKRLKINAYADSAGKATNLTSAPLVAWTGGTSTGPSLKVTAGGQTSTGVAIPAATGSASGVVTTSTQTFAGVKTFSNTTESTSTTTGAVKISGGLGVAGQINAAGVTADTFTGNLDGNAATATEFADNKSVTLSGDVIGTASSKAGWAITTVLAGNIPNSKLSNSSVSIAGNNIPLGGGLDAATLRSSLGLASALRFVGKTTTAIVDGATTNPITVGGADYTAVTGDVVINNINEKEYVWLDNYWELLGAESSYKVVQEAVDSPTASGSTTAFIDTISQDANGKITVTKKNLDTSGQWDGNVATATKVANSLKIQSNNTDSFTYDGSIAKILNIKNGNSINITSNTNGDITIDSISNCQQEFNSEELNSEILYVNADRLGGMALSEIENEFNFTQAEINALWS